MVEPQRTFTVPAGLTAIGKYQVVDRLGRGGMGTVYLARDPALDRLIAIKVLSGDLVDEETRERFSREARSVSRLRHPNIVTIFEYGDFTGQPFIAMEYISGESWAELIRRRAPVPLVRKLRMMEELCAGMAHAHRARIVHRDIKPANIMVDAESGSIKILDFGIASNVASNATLATLVVGTPSYMSPEQTTGQRVDHRSDVFTVGSVFYELLSYRQAFDGDTHVTIIEKILNGQARPLDELCPSIDPEIVKIVDTAMKKDPGTRYQDLDAMRADIQAVRERVHGSSGTEPTVLMDTARLALEDRAIDGYIRDARKHFEQNALTAAEQLVSDALKLRGTSPPAVAMQRELQQARWEQERAQERAVSAQAALDRAHASFAAGALESAVRAASEALAHDPGLSEAQTIKDRVATALAERQQQETEPRARTDLPRRIERLRRAGVWVVSLMLAGIVLFAAVRSVRKPVGGPPPDPAALSPVLAPVLSPVLASRLIAPGNVTIPSLNPRPVSLNARDEAVTPHSSGTGASPGTPASTRTPASTATSASLETAASTGTPASLETPASTRTPASTATLASTGTPPALPEPTAPPGRSALSPTSPSDYPPKELDRIVSPVALYPDPLLAQLLAAATFAPEIPDAARWADQHHYLVPAALAAAVAADRLPWQPSVQALLPFPSVLDMMGADMPWTQEIGRAFLGEPQGVMDAVQRMRRLAMDYGYLRSNPRIVVHDGPYIEILPANPAFIVVPYYKPAVVFARPQPGVVVAAGAINLRFGVAVSPAFAPWGWGTTRFAWANHRVLVNNAAWGRTWANRAVYVHPYAVPRYGAVRAAEQHQLIERNQREREAVQNGRGRGEEHRGGASRPGGVRGRPGTAGQRPRP
jgi:hypothetical protein